MQVVVHLRTVEPSDAHCGNRIADNGRGGKRSVQCSVFSVQRSVGDREREFYRERWGQKKAGDREREFVGVWECVGRKRKS